MMDNMAKEFPGAFSGYKLEVTESHQRTKADTSGTAKAVVGSLQQLGLDFSEVCKASQATRSAILIAVLIPPALVMNANTLILISFKGCVPCSPKSRKSEKKGLN